MARSKATATKALRLIFIISSPRRADKPSIDATALRAIVENT